MLSLVWRGLLINLLTFSAFITGTVFTTSACESTATLMCGNNSQNFSTICPLLPLSKTRSSVSTAVSHLALTPLTRFVSWTASRKLLMRDLSAIYFGLTPMTDAVGVSVPEALATASVRISQSSLTTLTTWQESHAPINWSWTDTTGLTSET